MLRTSVTTLSLLATITSMMMAQSSYRPFPESDAGWLEGHGWMTGNLLECSDFDIVACETAIRFGQDTTIAGVSYHRLIAHSLCSVDPVPLPWVPWDCFDDYVEPWSDLYYFRQDTTEKKVWVYDAFESEEKLLFDFDMAIGPYPETVLSFGSTCHVVAFDSVEMNSGWHRAWHVATGPGMEPFCTIIDGIGSTYGLKPVYGLVPPFEHGDVLLCHTQDENTVLPLGGTTCVTNVSVQALTAITDEITAVPNPAVEAIRISGAIARNCRYMVTDLTGKSVAEGQLSLGVIGCEGWAPGMYVIMLREGQGAQRSVRVMKE